ncbi:ureidoglycolate lyase [Thalassomonas viridans]|uniref:Ureidoglycolate lyase n=1 Tax=Thalassomonas viridans TaxID=137584 RepID=A0AAF0CE91_9GAMM|nr:ureidoglycolate lyase [Thalassomonas viridans]WDE09286.1 ureidoglycolate lyase [Thalassomonas viridans]
MKKDSSTAAPCIAVDTMPSIHQSDIKLHQVPVIRANQANFAPFGRLVRNYDKEEVIIETWPAPGWRKVEPGTGNEGGITEGQFVFQRKGGLMLARNHAVDGNYISGWFTDPATASGQQTDVDYSRVLVREANYHPDGGQVFYPAEGTPFIALLALPGDGICPEDFVGFYCDGSFGIQILPNIWHQPIFPLAQQANFQGKQGKVHACIACDFVEEFSCYLSLELAVPE